MNLFDYYIIKHNNIIMDIKPIKQEIKDKITQYYFNPVTGYKNANQIYNELNKSIPLKTIKYVLSNIETIQNKKPVLKKPNFIPIVEKPDSFQIDLTFYDQYKKFNSGYTGFMTVININSRFASCYPFKTKSSNEIYELINKFVYEAEPKIIETDLGSEFNNTKIKNYLKDNNIEIRFFNKSESPNAISKVERFNRTIRQKITDYMNTNNTNKYIDVLNQLVNNYNNTIHNSIKEKPIDIDIIGERKIYMNELRKQNEIYKDIHNKFKIGEFIRIVRTKGMFDKGIQKLSTSVYKITGNEGARVKIENIKTKAIKFVLPNSIFIVPDPKNLIIKKQTRSKNLEKKKTELKEMKQENKQRKFLKKEGLI